MRNNVFIIRQIENVGELNRFSASVMESHMVFAGHFPSQPVVPGVCTLAMIKDCVAQILSRSVRFAYLKECKFLSPIIPGKHKELIVSIILKINGDHLDVVADVADNSSKVLKLKSTMQYND
jgi:3-hydroxyacyl-[acyl-carrier-protein] dehydratase